MTKLCRHGRGELRGRERPRWGAKRQAAACAAEDKDNELLSILVPRRRDLSVCAPQRGHSCHRSSCPRSSRPRDASRPRLISHLIKSFIQCGLLAAAFLALPYAGQAASPPKTAVVYDLRSGKAVSEAGFVDRLAQADAVCVGEQHTDPATHRWELALLQDLHRRVGTRLTLGMEMWERDVQPDLDAYLAGKADEAAFLRVSRPWSNYETDYRPLVQYAKTSHIPVVASNAPQALAAAVGRRGLAALQDAPAGQAASDIVAPHDQAWTRFRAVMLSMGGAHGGMTMDDAAVAHFYDAQVLRDATMADSVVHALDAHPGAFVLHINGQFHSDYGDGIPRRIVWRRPLTKVLIVSVIPVPDPSQAAPATDKSLADYVVYVQAPPALP